MSKHVIQNDILRTLRDARGHPLPQDVLVGQVRDRSRPWPTVAEINSEIEFMKSVGFISELPNELDPETPAWLLAEKGEAYVVKKSL